MMLVMAVSGEKDLGPEVNTKIHLLKPTDVSRLQAEFADVFSPLPGLTNLIQHHIETEPCMVVHSWPYRLPEHKKVVCPLAICKDS